MAEIREIGSRWELFLDRWLIAKIEGDARLELHPPERREVVLTTDKAWEGNDSAYYCIVNDNGKIRIFYRGYTPGECTPGTLTCMVESHDGIHFTRPTLGLYDFEGSKENNVVWQGYEAHCLAIFLDTKPDAPADARYKALGITGKMELNGLYALQSPDGIHWKRISERPVLSKGAFDSLNVAFWDSHAGLYRAYVRYYTEDHIKQFQGIRCIQGNTSPDFLNWSDPQPNLYEDGIPLEQFYTSSTTPCPGAEHILLAFPKRFIPERKKNPEHKEAGISDGVLMSSRDGVHWDRTFLEAWLRPGTDQKNWTDRNNMIAWGIAATGENEFSLYASEHYRWPDNRLRRLVIGRHRFASVHAGASGGVMTTHPFTFNGAKLVINASTSAAGSISCSLLDEDGGTIPGLSNEGTEAWFGDEFNAVFRWKSDDLSKLRGKAARLRVELADADLFAIRFV